MFEAHGNHKIWTKEHVLYIEGHGSWNKEEAISFAQDVHEVVHSDIVPKFSQFGTIIIMKDWFPTIDAIQTLYGVTLAGIQSGMRFEAVVETDYLSMKILMGKVFPENSDIYTCKVLPSIEEAESWIKSGLCNNKNSKTATG